MAVGVAAFGALVPAGAALGHGSVAAYVAGFHHALYAGAAIAAAGTVATAALIAARRARTDHTQPISAAEPAAELA
jgi:hypothetical protein